MDGCVLRGRTEIDELKLVHRTTLLDAIGGCGMWVRLMGAWGKCWGAGLGERDWGRSDFGVGFVFGFMEFGGEHGDEARDFDKGILCFF